MIIIHGLFGLSDNWAWFGKKLGQQNAVYTIDLRNHGLSPHDAVMNYHAMASDLEEFIEMHNLVNPVIVGHSMGGKVVMQFLKNNPGIAGGAMILDISPAQYKTRKTHLDILMAMKSVDMAAFSSRKEIMKVIEEKIADKQLQQFVMKNLKRSGKNLFSWKPNIDVILESLEDIFSGIDAPEEKPQIPVQFLRGGSSDYIRDGDIDVIEEKWSSMPIITVPDASHWLHVDASLTVLSSILTFLNRI